MINVQLNMKLIVPAKLIIFSALKYIIFSKNILETGLADVQES